MALPSAGTSKTYPCGSSKSFPPPGPSTVSSQVSHDPHGVGPPAQLTAVPARLTQARRTEPLAVSNSTVVVPPQPFRS